MRIIDWVKTHKLIVLLVLVIFYLIFIKGNYYNPMLRSTALYNVSTDYGVSSSAPVPAMGSVSVGLPSFTTEKSLNSTQITSARMVIQESNLSLLVKNVKDTGDKIIAYAQKNGGYMVNTSYTRPDESPFGSITIRIPTNNLNQSLTYFQSLSLKVTNENLTGTDITDQYKDIEKRLTILKKTESRFNEILDKAVTVQDILNVQQQIIYLQDQIESLIGQKQAMEQSAQLSRITIFLSTDELALPYTPDKSFRPDVIFKQATRSMLGTLRDLGETLIWLGVYSIFWGPVLIGFIIYKKRKLKKVTPGTRAN